MIPQSALRDAVSCVRRGGVVVYPTETVYGLGGDAENPVVVERVRTIKGRSDNKPMLVLTDTWQRVFPWILSPGPEQKKLMELDPPLPITLLFNPSPVAPTNVYHPSEWIAVRRTSHPFCLDLIQQSERLLLSTSANLSGQPVANRAEDLDESICRAADLLVSADGQLAGTPSSVVLISDGKIKMVREGAVSRLELENLLSR